MALTVAATLAIVGAVAPGAHALALVQRNGRPVPRQFVHWIRESKVPAPTGRAIVVFAPCPNPGPEVAYGCVYPEDVPPVIFLGPHARDRYMFMHEVGHIYDTQAMTDASRFAYGALLGQDGPWSDDGTTRPLGEEFADDYSACSIDDDAASSPAACRLIRSLRQSARRPSQRAAGSGR
jgi:hypothetical protein